MKLFRAIHIIFVLIATCGVVNAQDVVLEKIQRGDKFVVIAYNKSATAQLVTLDLTLEYVQVNRELPVVEIVEPGEKKELVVLAPIPLEAWSYKTRYQFEEYVEPVKAQTESYHLRIPNNVAKAEVVEEELEEVVVLEVEKSDSVTATTVSLQLSEEEIPVKDEEVLSHPVNRSPYRVPESVGGTTITSEVVTITVKPASSMRPPQNTDDEPMPAKYASRLKGH